MPPSSQIRDAGAPDPDQFSTREAAARLVVEAEPKVWPNGGLVTIFGDFPLDAPPQLIHGDRSRVTFDGFPTGLMTIHFNGWARAEDPTDAFGSITDRTVTLKAGKITTFRIKKR